VVEADRVCRALHVDGRQVWRLTGAAPGDGLQVGLDISYDG
jgi:hypothetical protein